MIERPQIGELVSTNISHHPFGVVVSDRMLYHNRRGYYRVFFLGGDYVYELEIFEDGLVKTEYDYNENGEVFHTNPRENKE